MTVHGPRDCTDSGIVAVEVPKADVVVPPLFCRLLPYITAFLAALFIGICLVCAAFEITQAQEDDTWVITVTALSLLLFGVAVIFWMRIGKEHNCGPNRCGWLAVGWTAMLTALAVTFFMLECFSAWVPLAIVFFVLFAFLAYLWFKKLCIGVKSKRAVYLRDHCAGSILHCKFCHSSALADLLSVGTDDHLSINIPKQISPRKGAIILVLNS